MTRVPISPACRCPVRPRRGGRAHPAAQRLRGRPDGRPPAWITARRDAYYGELQQRIANATADASCWRSRIGRWSPSWASRLDEDAAYVRRRRAPPRDGDGSRRRRRNGAGRGVGPHAPARRPSACTRAAGYKRLLIGALAAQRAGPAHLPGVRLRAVRVDPGQGAPEAQASGHRSATRAVRQRQLRKMPPPPIRALAGARPALAPCRGSTERALVALRGLPLVARASRRRRRATAQESASLVVRR